MKTSRDYFLKGKEQTAKKKYDPAEANLTKALELAKKEPKTVSLDEKEIAEVWYLLGHIYNETIRYAEALKHLKKAVSLNPDLTNAWISMAFCYYRENNIKKAAEAMNEASKLEPDNVFVLTNLAGIYLNLNELKKAESVLNKGIKMYPKDGNICYNFACLYARMENKEDCLKYLEKAIKNGTPLLQGIKEESDFNYVKGDKDFKNLLNSI